MADLILGKRGALAPGKSPLKLKGLSREQRALLKRARQLDDEMPFRIDVIRSERAQAFRDCVAGGLTAHQISRYLMKDPHVVLRQLKGPLPVEKWKPEPEGDTTE